MQILVVEDDVRLAQALCRILEESGYKTDAVHDGQSGLDYAESGIYDVVILDVMLPKMDGFTVVSNLRRAGVNTPVLLLTARDAVPDKICGLDSGARRLHDQAVFTSRAHGAPARTHAPAKARCSSRRSRRGTFH